MYAPGFDRRLEQPLAAALVVPPEARLVLTEGNYLLLDSPPWAAVRQQIDSVWFVVSAEDVRVERLVARHVEFGKSPRDGRRLGRPAPTNATPTWCRRRSGPPTALIVNGADGWRLAGIA